MNSTTRDPYSDCAVCASRPLRSSCVGSGNAAIARTASAADCACAGAIVAAGAAGAAIGGAGEGSLGAGGAAGWRMPARSSSGRLRSACHCTLLSPLMGSVLRRGGGTLHASGRCGAVPRTGTAGRKIGERETCRYWGQPAGPAS
ncbi:hypothetical protein D9T17_05835 [Lysobacter enzymogenes]|uniref:Uncharacterized protein n=1 Tax=Lysobacter enzymogenes TaxID=69 RepID=A0A3N2RL61_LYSEN|nr:hypothetical protein D9T17_05835 [Lysobacter enzymogenes]